MTKRYILTAYRQSLQESQKKSNVYYDLWKYDLFNKKNVAIDLKLGLGNCT